MTGVGPCDCDSSFPFPAWGHPAQGEGAGGHQPSVGGTNPSVTLLPLQASLLPSPPVPLLPLVCPAHLSPATFCLKGKGLLSRPVSPAGLAPALCPPAPEVLGAPLRSSVGTFRVHSWANQGGGKGVHRSPAETWRAWVPGHLHWALLTPQHAGSPDITYCGWTHSSRHLFWSP